MCVTLLLLIPTHYSPQQIHFILTYSYVLSLDQQTKFQTDIKHAELPLLLDVRLVASWWTVSGELGYTSSREREFSLFTAP
jgi:hypothetical protein